MHRWKENTQQEFSALQGDRLFSHIFVIGHVGIGIAHRAAVVVTIDFPKGILDFFHLLLAYGSDNCGLHGCGSQKQRVGDSDGIEQGGVYLSVLIYLYYIIIGWDHTGAFNKNVAVSHDQLTLNIALGTDRSDLCGSCVQLAFGSGFAMFFFALLYWE